MVRKLAGDQPIVQTPEDIQTNDRKPPYQSNLIPAELDEKETSKLLSACKKHKVTVHSFVQTAACIAYVRLPNARRTNNAHCTKYAGIRRRIYQRRVKKQHLRIYYSHLYHTAITLYQQPAFHFFPTLLLFLSYSVSYLSNPRSTHLYSDPYSIPG